MLFFEEVIYTKKIQKSIYQRIYGPTKKEQEIDHCEYMSFVCFIAYIDYILVVNKICKHPTVYK